MKHPWHGDRLAHSWLETFMLHMNSSTKHQKSDDINLHKLKELVIGLAIFYYTFYFV